MYAYSGVNDFYFFVYYLFALIVLVFGTIGNISALLVLSRKRLNKFGPLIIYRFLFIVDGIYLLLILTNYLSTSYGITYLPNSSFGCKFYYYLHHSTSSYSPEAIAFISIDRLISIRYPNKRFLLKQKKVQFFVILSFIAFNLLYNVPVLLNYEAYVRNGTKVCTSNKPTMKLTILYMDLSYRIIFLTSVMLITSVITIYSIFKSRLRMQSATSRETQKLKRDIRLAVTSISINIIYFLLNAPYNVCSFLSSFIPGYSYYLTYNIFYTSYAINFYIILASNSLFKREYLALFRYKELKNHLVKSTNSNNPKGTINT